MKGRDEHYVIDLCDSVLALKAKRQHRFDFLLGDVRPNGRRYKLPVDAYYEKLQLVIEYRECQHTEATFFDRRPGRREQRKRYDQLRRELLLLNGIQLVELGYELFPCNARKRLLRRRQADEAVIRHKLDEVFATRRER